MTEEYPTEIEVRNTVFRKRKADALLAIMAEGSMQEGGSAVFRMKQIKDKCGEKHGYGLATNDAYNDILLPLAKACEAEGYIEIDEHRPKRVKDSTSKNHHIDRLILCEKGVDYYNDTLLPLLNAELEKARSATRYTPVSHMPVDRELATELGMTILGSPELLALLRFSPHMKELLPKLEKSKYGREL